MNSDEQTVVTRDDLLQVVDQAVKEDRSKHRPLQSLKEPREDLASERERVFNLKIGERTTLHFVCEDHDEPAITIKAIGPDPVSEEFVESGTAEMARMNFKLIVGRWVLNQDRKIEFSALFYCSGMDRRAAASNLLAVFEFIVAAFHVGYSFMTDAFSGAILAEKGESQRHIDTFVASRGWHSRFERKSTRVVRALRCNDETIRCTLRLRVKRDIQRSCITITYHGILDQHCPSRARENMSIEIMKANRDLISGVFDMDHTDGEVIFRTHVPLRGVDTTQLPFYIESAVEAAENAIKKYRHKLNGAVSGIADVGDLASLLGLGQGPARRPQAPDSMDLLMRMLAGLGGAGPRPSPMDSMPVHSVRPDVMTAGLRDLLNAGPDHESQVGPMTVAKPDIADSILLSIRPDAIATTEVLGKEGLLGVVYKGTFNNDDCAIKRVPRADQEEEDHKRIMGELEKQASHPFKYVVLLIGVSETDEYLDIVSEFCDNGPLDQYLEANPGLSRDRKIKLALDIAYGMSYLHRRRREPHTALKPTNVLVDKYGVAKIADFGARNFVTSHTMTSSMSSMEAGISYMAPEIMSARKPSLKADVYAYGILLWQIFTQQKPYSMRLQEARQQMVSMIAHRILEDNLRPVIPDSVPRPIANLIKQCWQSDPRVRPDFGAVVDELRSLDKA